MKKSSIIILVVSMTILILGIIFFVWSLNYNKVPQEDIAVEEESKTRDLENPSYTDFVFYREDKTEVKFSDYKDKATMILFWNPSNSDSVEDLKK